jgi:hypothetical protein
MPLHSQTKSHGGNTTQASKAKKKSPKSAAGGALEGDLTTRSQVTGRQLGKAAIQALTKNAERASSYLEMLETSTSTVAFLAACKTAGFQLARVERATGAGHLSVKLQSQKPDEEPVSVPISGKLRFHGHASADSKKGLPHCMQAGDIILLDGPWAAAKFSAVALERIQRGFRVLGVPEPRGFFEDVDEFFDRSEERKQEEKLMEELRRARGGRGAAVSAGRVLQEAVDGTEFEAEAEDEEEGGAAAGGGKKPKKQPVDRTAPNRAERRAAQRAAAEAVPVAEEEDADDMWADVGEIKIPMKACWEDDEDEVDVDAI